MARVKAQESKSDIVREYLRGKPTATVNEIVNDLKPYDISQALAQKIKYKDGSRRGRRPRKGPAAEAMSSFTPPAPAAGETKADAIRRIAQAMGKRVRPRDVIAALKSEGTEASFAQVGQVLKSMGMRPRRGRMSRTEAGLPRAPRSTESSTISLDALMAAKRLADQLGGVRAAKEAMDALAKLS